MSEMLSYLLAQARRQPLDTLRFAASEAWRRGRLRWVDSLDKNLPQFPDGFSGRNFSAFLPPEALDRSRLGELPFAARVIENARQVCRHQFEVFGEQVTFGPEIDWHCDWRTGFRWPLERPAGMSVLASQSGAPAGTDIKRPWEIGRFHQALALGQAFAQTRDESFASEFVAQVRHWIRSNPYPRGVHWAMPMEVAVRAVNWVTAAAFFAGSEGLDAEFQSELLENLFLHGRHLATHGEWNPVARANHYLACITGLLHLGVLFETMPEGREWLALARREVLGEMMNLVGEDGVAREGSSGYHAFVTELFLTCGLLLARAGEKQHAGAAEIRAGIESSCGSAYATRLEGMFRFLNALCASRENPPVWGDADDGRLLPFGGGSPNAVISLADVGAALSGTPCPSPAEGSAVEIFWRLGIIPKSSTSVLGAPEAAAFPAAGFFFFSSPRLRGSIRCGPLGARGWSNHAHGDQLSVEFCCDGRAVVVDPGLPCYAEDPAARNLFRSTRYHNVVVIAGAEQNRFWPRLLFRIVDDTQSRLLRWDAGSHGVHFCGEHFGYQRLDAHAMVRREVRLDAQHNVLTLFDNLSLRGRAPVEWLFHLAPEISPQFLADTAPGAFSVPGSAALAWDSAWQLGPVVLRVWTSLDPKTLVSRQEEGWVAPCFGKKVRAPILSISGAAGGSVSAAFEFSVSGHNTAAREARD